MAVETVDVILGGRPYAVAVLTDRERLLTIGRDMQALGVRLQAMAAEIEGDIDDLDRIAGNALAIKETLSSTLRAYAPGLSLAAVRAAKSRELQDALDVLVAASLRSVTGAPATAGR